MLMWLSQRGLLLALPLVVLLLSSSASAASAAASSGGEKNPILTPAPLTVLDTSVIQGRPMRIVVAGPRGAGKTLFCEFLVLALRTSGMADPAQASAEILRRWEQTRGFSDLVRTLRVTKYTYTETLRVGGSVEIYDTPGLFSTDSPAGSIKELMESLDYVDAVILVFNGREEHSESTPGLVAVLAQLSALFPRAVHPNIALLFNRLDNQQTLPSLFEPTSEELKSRSFFVDNPLHSVKEQTIASVLQSGPMQWRTSDCRRYNDGVQELNRLLQYLAKIPRWTNQDVSTDLLSKRAEAELQASNLAMKKSMKSAEVELHAVKLQEQEERKMRGKVERQVTKLREKLRENDKRKKSVEDELVAVKLRAGEETKQRDQADLAMKQEQQECEKCAAALRVEMDNLRTKLKLMKLRVKDEKKKRAEALQLMELRVEEESRKRAEAERQVTNLRERLEEELREKDASKNSAKDELEAVKLRAGEETARRAEAVRVELEMLRRKLNLTKLEEQEERKKRSEADHAMNLQVEVESRKRAEAERQVRNLQAELGENEKSKKSAEVELEAVKLREKMEIEKRAKADRQAAMLRAKLELMERRAEEENKKRAEVSGHRQS